MSIRLDKKVKKISIVLICLILLILSLSFLFSSHSPNYVFSDNFDYKNISELEKSGWSFQQENSDLIELENGLLTLKNTGNGDSSIIKSDLPQLKNWCITAKILNTGKKYGGPVLHIYTDKHHHKWGFYGWHANYRYNYDGDIKFIVPFFEKNNKRWITLSIRKKDRKYYFTANDKNKEWIQPEEPCPIKKIKINTELTGEIKVDWIYMIKK